MARRLHPVHALMAMEGDVQPDQVLNSISWPDIGRSTVPANDQLGTISAACLPETTTVAYGSTRMWRFPSGRRSPRAPFFRGFHRLTVDDSGAGGRVSALVGPHRRPQGLLAGPGAVLGPAPAIFVQVSKIVRQQAPGAAPQHLPCSTSRRSTDRSAAGFTEEPAVTGRRLTGVHV